VARRRAAHRGVLTLAGAFAGRDEPSRPIQFRPSASDFVAADTGAPLVPETIDICPLSELPPGATRIVEWEDLEIGIFNCNGELFALEDRCSHDDGPLAEGELDPENCTVECPRHGSLFDLRTGKPKTLPAYVPVDTFPVRVEDDIVKLEVD
jgi:3-phenylpropionate/trans-cinnamate dioxygenase ferredoxin subunit